MELVTVRDLFKHTADYAGKTVSVGGWVRSVRASKTFGFIVLSDGTFFQPLQVVYHDTMDNFAAISKTNVGAALIVRGKLVETPDARQPLSCRPRRSRSRALPRRTIPCRKSATRWNICAR